MDVVLVGMLGAIGTLAVLGVVAAWVWVYLDNRKRQRLMSDAMQNLADGCNLLSSQIGGLSETPKYIEGMTKVCGDFVVQVEEMKQLVDRFRLSLFGPEKARKEQDLAAFQEYTDQAADESYEIQQMVEAGFDVGEATQKVKGLKSGRFTLG